MVNLCMGHCIFDILLEGSWNTGGSNVEQVALLNHGLPRTLSKQQQFMVLFSFSSSDVKFDVRSIDLIEPNPLLSSLLDTDLVSGLI